jgi:threonine/homoserine/homoserine lactone efflux protein
MLHLELLIRGALAGLAISAPVGPVNVLCVRRTLAKGRMAGLISGLGAATADTMFGAIAGYSISFIIALLLKEEFWIRLIGGALLVGVGCAYYFRKPKPLAEARKESAHSAYFSSLLLCLTNPTVILSFMAVLAGLGMGGLKQRSLTLIVVLGIFLGSMLWWSFLALVAGHFRHRITDAAMGWMNRIAGIAIGAFGIVTLLLSAGTPR